MNAVAYDTILELRPADFRSANTAATSDESIKNRFLVKGSFAAEVMAKQLTPHKWLNFLRSATELSGWSWQAPHVSIDSSGESLFEWWRKDRKLSIYISEPVPEFIKIWGAHIDDEMESGPLQSSESFRALWDWLHAVD